MTDTVHIVVRFSDAMFGVGDVISKHNDVVATRGAVWFGKLVTWCLNSAMNCLPDLTAYAKVGHQPEPQGGDEPCAVANLTSLS